MPVSKKPRKSATYVQTIGNKQIVHRRHTSIPKHLQDVDVEEQKKEQEALKSR